MPQDQELVYRIDQRDEICFANEAYDAFAAANLGGDVASSAVLGAPLWRFIGDSTTEQLYRELVRQARGGRTLRLTLRCDSPTERRLLGMTISAAAAGEVEFRTRVLQREYRSFQGLLDPTASRTGEHLRTCSWCKHFFVDGRWVEVEACVDRLRLFERPVLPALTHGICESCHEIVLRSI